MNIWGRLGISVAIVAAFSIVMTEVLQTRHFYQVYRWGICAGLLGMGLFLWIVGKFVNARLRQSKRQVTEEGQEEGQQPEEQSDPFILVNLAYWGMMLTIFGIIAIFIVPSAKNEALPVAAATAPPVEKKEAPVTNAEPELVVEPPAPKRPLPTSLKLQGIVYKMSNPSALINGRTYFVGETVSNATVVAIEGETAVLELDGQRMILELPK